MCCVSSLCLGRGITFIYYIPIHGGSRLVPRPYLKMKTRLADFRKPKIFETYSVFILARLLLYNTIVNSSWLQEVFLANHLCLTLTFGKRYCCVCLNSSILAWFCKFNDCWSLEITWQAFSITGNFTHAQTVNTRPLIRGRGLGTKLRECNCSTKH